MTAAVAEAPQAQSAPPDQSRTSEILSAVDELIRVHDDWERDETAPTVPTEAFESALIHAAEVCDSGDTPMLCRDVVLAMARLAEEWNQYADGLMERGTRRPLPKFWAAFRAVQHTRAQAVVPARRRLEPVADLLKQGVSYHQIARHIYGHDGTGPFLQANGQPDIGKINQEAEKPGSVIPPDWVHPSELQSQQPISRLARRVADVQRREPKPAPVLDKASVESLLREGQFPAVIARVKGITVEEVYAEAKRLGLTPEEKPSLSEMANYKPPANGSDAAADGGADYSPRPTTAGKPTDDEVRGMILERLNSGQDAGTVAAGLKEAGIVVSPQKIAAVWREARKAATSLPSTGGTGDDDDDDTEED